VSVTVTLVRPPSLFDTEQPAAGSRDDRSTLEDLVLGVWEDLSSRRPGAVCVVCRGEMMARYGAGSAPVAGRCLDCGSELA